MATTGFGAIALFMMLLSGGANDLLDFVSTDYYWKNKGVPHVTAQQLIDELKPAAAGPDVAKLVVTLASDSFEEREKAAAAILKHGPAVIPQLEAAAATPDLEVANRAKVLIQQLRVSSKGAAVRQLMAIRTLGEMKKAEALPALKALTGSKEMFVADYAQAAVAMIEGKPLPPRVTSKDAMKNDLSLLPANIGLVGQLSVLAPPGARRISFDEVLKQLPPTPGENREQMVQQMQQSILSVADRIGNVRIEGLTFAVSDDIDDLKGFVAVIARGQFDAKAVAIHMRNLVKNADAVEGVEVFTPEKNTAFAFPTDDRAMLVVGPKAEHLPVKALLASIRDNKGALLTNADVAKLIAGVDTSAPLWAVCKVNDKYREAEVIKAFDSITLVTKQTKDSVEIRINGTGSNPAAVQEAVNQLTSGLNEARQHVPQMAQQMPMLKPVADFLTSAKCQADGNDASFTAAVPGSGNALMAAPLFMFGFRAHEVPVNPPGQP
jgi:hypothetical protein